MYTYIDYISQGHHCFLRLNMLHATKLSPNALPLMFPPCLLSLSQMGLSLPGPLVAFIHTRVLSHLLKYNFHPCVFTDRCLIACSHDSQSYRARFPNTNDSRSPSLARIFSMVHNME